MRQRTVLLIANDPQEIHLIQQTFAQMNVPHILQVVCDGADALAYLLPGGVSPPPRHAPLPDVIVLALPLPGLHDEEFVQRLKQDPRMKRLPIIVLGPSGPCEAMCQVYAAGANAYLRKPGERTHFIDVIKQIGTFWLETVELPSAY